ncbi:hypothetical protein R3P38DRAFT_2556889 [Favolaschia claudopus]|uniref:Uncharacterized protein n=1 Tax=Favolaschia claudopus TaxID=2862362 RepID=A0AAW0A9S6_9AGAR
MAGGATKCENAGATRLYKILITESAHLIWKLRNERVIQETGSAPLAKIRNRWLRAINSRLAMDCAMTDRFKWGKKALKTKQTWKKTLKDELTLSRTWPMKSGVLVGIG